MAHRIMYQLTKGPIPNDLEIMHTCDIGNCINPDHLVLGTHIDNMKDAANKGRLFHKLTPKQREKIKLDRRNGTIVAKEYGVGKSIINKIRYG